MNDISQILQAIEQGDPQVAGQPLKNINFHTTPVPDLTPLRGMPLRGLNCATTPVTDFSPLQGSPIQGVSWPGTRADLSVLKHLPLRQLDLDFSPGRDTEWLKGMKTLEKINN